MKLLGFTFISTDDHCDTSFWLTLHEDRPMSSQKINWNTHVDTHPWKRESRQRVSNFQIYSRLFNDPMTIKL